MNKIITVSIVFGLIVCLALIRFFQYDLFYDPFLAYFSGSFYNASIPNYDLAKLILNYFFRFGLNTLITCLIIYFIFKNLNYIKLTLIIAGIGFVICTSIYVYFIETNFSFGHNLAFGVRRFIIQPMILLILVPAFFYQKIRKKNIEN